MAGGQRTYLNARVTSTQCRTWPFWPDMMSAKAWSKEVLGFCPGVGKGRLYTEREIESLLTVQRRATLKL